MAYIVTSHRGQEIARQNLTAALTVGRSSECTLCIHDILLSRKHCRLEHHQGNWTVVDLSSKNGTMINGRRVQGRHALVGGDRLQIGRSVISFFAGVMAADASRKSRPVDPWEARSSTLFALDLHHEEASEESGPRPVPRPAPKPPQGYETDGVHELIEGLLHSFAESAEESEDALESMELGKRTAKRPRRPRLGLGRLSKDFWIAAALAVSATVTVFAVALLFKV